MIYKKIENKIIQEFNPLALEIIDESHLHAGHAGSRPEGETHFYIKLVSKKFTGLSLIARHRLIYDCLQQEMNSSIHALRIEALAP